MFESETVNKKYLALPEEVSKVLKAINKNGTKPLYIQLIDLLKEVIEKKDVKEGDFFATESLIQKKTQLSRSTVRKALEEMVRQNYLIRITIKGTLVWHYVHKKSVVKSEEKNMSQELEEKGKASRSILLNVKKLKPSKNIINKLQLTENEKVLYIERIRPGNDIPILYIEGYVSLKFGDFHTNDIPNSLYKMVRDNGVILQNAEHIIGATNMTSKISKHLGVAEGSAGITMKRVTFESSSKP